MTEAESELILVGGVMWCSTHSGLLDEISSNVDECDNADDETPCVIHEMFYRERTSGI